MSRSPEDERSYAVHPKDLDMPDATRGVGFACADLTTFCRLDELGLEVTGQRVQADRAESPRMTRGVAVAVSKAVRAIP